MQESLYTSGHSIPKLGVLSFRCVTRLTKLVENSCAVESVFPTEKSDFPNRPRTGMMFFALLRASSRINRSS